MEPPPDARPLPRCRKGAAADTRAAAGVAAAVTGALLAASHAEAGDAWAAVNDISHLVLGRERSAARGFHPLNSLLGLTLNAAAVGTWALLYRRLCGRPRRGQAVVSAAAFAAAVYFLDYHLLPRRLAPGMESSLSPRAIAFLYLVLGGSLCVVAPPPPSEARGPQDGSCSEEGRSR